MPKYGRLLINLLTKLSYITERPSVNKLVTILYLSLQGKAREYVRDIKEDDICSDTDFEIILNKLDEIYLKDKGYQSVSGYGRVHGI